MPNANRVVDPEVMPRLPNLQEILGGSPEASFQNIVALLRAPQGRLTDYLPYASQMLGESSRFLEPAVQGIRQGAQATAAAAQSDAMKRGLTGSDIELANIRGARQAGEQQVGQLLGQVGMQQASQMAQMLMQAAGYDLQANREMFVTLAQALGQELTQQRERLMNERLIEASMAEAARRRGGMFGGGLGSLLGAGAGLGIAAMFPGAMTPMQALAGAGLGGSLGQSFGTGIGGY